MTDTVEQKREQSWGEFLHVTTQKARDALPGKIRDSIIVKCSEVAETGKMEHELTLKDLDIKITDKAEQGVLLDGVVKLLRQDGLDATVKYTGGLMFSEWTGIWVSWAKVKVATPKTEATPALNHDIEI